MSAEKSFLNVETFAAELHRLREARQNTVLKLKSVRPKRHGLTAAERAEVLRKAGGRCHICGGVITGEDWEADHVFAHSSGGAHSVENYLPAHCLCNNYRWNYGTEEFQWILKLGVWLRTQIERDTLVGRAAGAAFVEHEKARTARRKHRRKEILGQGNVRGIGPKAPRGAATLDHAQPDYE